jgi:hypothetical protein
MTAFSQPTYDANACSNSAVFGPVVSQPDRITSETALIVSSSINGRKKGIFKGNIEIWQQLPLLIVPLNYPQKAQTIPNYKTLYIKKAIYFSRKCH